MTEDQPTAESEAVLEGTPEQEQQQEQEQEKLSDEQKAMAKLKEAITVEKEEIGALHMKLTITVPRETLDERMSEQFANLKRDSLVPGFRKGHAPMRLVEKRFGADVGDQLKSQLIGGAYLAAVEKEELKPLGEPLFWAKIRESRTGKNQTTETVVTEKLVSTDQAIESLTLPAEGAFTYSCEVELKPEFALPELTQIPVKRPHVSITDDDVEIELNRMRMSRATFKPVEDGPVETDDLLYVDVAMSVDGEVVQSEENTSMAARDLALFGVPLVGLGEAIVGKNNGDEVSLEANVPDDHDTIELRGQTATFTIKIHEIKRMDLPPFDEDFLSTLGMDSEKELREIIRSNLESTLDQTLQRAMRQQVGQYLVDHTSIEIPEGISRRQTQRSLARRRLEMLRGGAPETEVEKSMDELQAKAHDQVVYDLKLLFILEKISEEQDITVSEEELNNTIARIARRCGKRFDRVRDDLIKGDGLTTLYMQLRDEKIIDQLLTEATIEEVEGPKKKKPAKPSAKKSKKKAPKKTS